MKKKINLIILIFFLIFFITRLFVSQTLDGNTILTTKINLAYLDKNFLDIFIFNHTIPSGHLLIAKVISLVKDQSLITKIYYILNIFFSLGSVMLIYKTLNIFFKNKIILFYILFLISFLLIPYELWRLNHHDHINILNISYVIWAFKEFLYNKKINNLIISLILLNFFYSLGFIITILTLLTIFLFNQENQFFKINFLKIISPILIILIIFTKNYYTVNSFAPTSMSGANLIQRTIHSIGEQQFIILINKNKNTFPEWWHELVTKIKLENNYKNLDKNIIISNFAHGNISDTLYKNTIEYNNLKYKDKKLFKYIIQDINNLKNSEKNNLYKFGYSQTLASSYYQSFGKLVFLKACIDYPYQMFIGNIGAKGFFLTTLQSLSFGGLFPTYYENHLTYWNSYLFYYVQFFRVIILSIFILNLMNVILIIKKIFTKRHNKNDVLLLFINTLIFSGSIVTSIITCCENPRIMAIYFPAFICISIMNIVFLYKRNFNNNS